MKISEDLTALVFELQRAGAQGEKARILARAWRTIRGLSPTERRLLAREVGFEGAEELIEGLAGESGGAFAPAVVLEALGKARRREGFSVRRILADLKDPDRRDDLLVRGMDLVADALGGAGDDEDGPVWTDESVEIEVPLPVPTAVKQVGESHADDMDVEAVSSSSDQAPATPEPSRPSSPVEPPAIEVIADRAPTVEPEPATAPRSEAVDPSSWDEMWGESQSVAAVPPPGRRTKRLRDPRGPFEPKRTEGSVLFRLRAFRETIPDLGNAAGNEIRNALDELPEAWARRRALVALIDADVPVDVAEILDLIEDLDRAMDRRWCLSALAVRGDLRGQDLERALGMLTSPGARRRVEALARASRG